MNISLLLLLCTLLLSPLHSLAESAPLEYPQEIADRVQKNYDTMQSLSFNFYQDTRGEMTGKPRKASGKAVFYKAEATQRMRWDYFSPDTQVLVSDGTSFSMYFSGLQQMIVTPAKNLETDLTYSFFIGNGSLRNDFHIRPADEDFQSENENEFKVIKLIPKVSQSQVQDIHIWVTNTSLIRRFKIRDLFGTITVLNLSDIEVNSLDGIASTDLDSIFSFDPPEGTEIIHQ